MQRTGLVLGMGALWLLAAPQAGAREASAQSGGPLPLGPVWELQSLTSGGKTQTPPRALNKPTLSFDGQAASGSGFCNSYRASYVSRGEILRFGPAVSTKRACMAILNTLETQYLNLLAGTNRYIVSGSTLTLYSGSQGRLLFSLQTRPQTGQPAPPKPTPVTGVQPMMVNPAPAISQKGLPPARTIFDNETATLDENEQLLIVAPQQTDCVSVVPERCLLVKRPAQFAWSLFYGAIEGFTYRSGTTSLLRVKLETLDRPAADGSTVRYRLVRVLGMQMARAPTSGR